MAGCATPTSSAGHATAGVRTLPKLTLQTDHLVGAGHDVAELLGQFQKPRLHPNDLLLLRHIVISVPPEGRPRSQLWVRTATRPPAPFRKPTTTVRLSSS